MSEESVTYLRLRGLDVDSDNLEREDDEGSVAEARSCGGVPGGVVDSTGVEP